MLTLEKVITLASVSIFAEIPEESLVEVASALVEIEVEAGEVIFKRGDIGTSMYIIAAGKVRIHDDNKELGILGEREVFGELAALDPEPRSASATAIEDAYLLRIDQELFLEVMTQHGNVARGVLRVLCQRIRQADALIHAMMTVGAQK